MKVFTCLGYVLPKLAQGLHMFGLEPHGREIRLALSTPLLQKPGEMTQVQIQSHRRGSSVAPSAVCHGVATLRNEEVLKFFLLLIPADF